MSRDAVSFEWVRRGIWYDVVLYVMFQLGSLVNIPSLLEFLFEVDKTL